MRILIIGSSGQDGILLKKQLSSQGFKVLGVGRGEVGTEDIRIENLEKMKEIIYDFKPEIVINLAAKASTKDKFIFQNYNAIIKGTQNIVSISKSIHKFHLINFGSIYQFQSSNKPIDCTKSPRDYSNHYSIFRNIQENILKDNQAHFESVRFLYMCHHESKYTSANNFTVDLIQHFQSILKGTNSRKLIVRNPLTVREWSDAIEITKALAKNIISNESLGFKAEIFNKMQGSTVSNFIQGFCDFNGINCFDFFQFNPDVKKYQTNNENLNFSAKSQKWINSFEF